MGKNQKFSYDNLFEKDRKYNQATHTRRRDTEPINGSSEIKDFLDYLESEELSEEKLTEYGQNIAEKSNSDSQTTTQIRGIYSTILDAYHAKDEKEKRKKLTLAKPKIAYRNRVIKNKQFVNIFLKLINKTLEEEKLKEHPKTFCQALIAYRKYYNKDSQGGNQS